MIEKDFVKVTNISIDDNKLKIDFVVSDNLKPYFNDFSFWAEYSVDITNTPDSVAVIPFVCNVLPIIWLTDSQLIVDEVDMNFYNNIDSVKNGYIEMYPNVFFGGDFHVQKLIANDTKGDKNKVACLFSGGIDAFATLFAHIDESPLLVTIWGADIRLSDIKSWEKVEQQVSLVAAENNLDLPIIIKSNFTEFLNQIKCNSLIAQEKENYWHGLQHGIGLISLTSILAFLNNLKTVYIASSFTEKDKGEIKCASFPTIDNNLHFVGTTVWHDQFDKTRQQKIGIITQYCKNNMKHVKLRTCFMDNGEGENCCKCEKCLRSIFGLLAEGEIPDDYGYDIDLSDLKEQINGIKHSMYLQPYFVKVLWNDIKKRFIETQFYKNHPNVKWIYCYDFFSGPSFLDILYHYKKALKNRFIKLIRKLK